MALAFRFAARSDVGRVRSKNDDSAYAGHHLAVVADGMGGHVGGDVASASAVIDLTHLDRGGYDGDATTVLADEIQNANQNLAELVQQHPRLGGMGTTVTALIVDDEQISLCHIGDSRAYRLRGTEFRQVTTDHTFVQRLIDEGRLRPEEAETHPHRNVLMRVLGDVDASPELESEVLAAGPGERWLLCSDGLNAVVRPETIERVLGSEAELDEIAQTLVDLTLERGAPDNVTVVVLEVVQAEDLETLGNPVGGALPDPDEALTSDQITDSARETAPRQEPLPGIPWAEPAQESDAGQDEAASGPSSAAALREGLDLHPHILVGAAANATQTGRIPTVSDSAMARRATLLRTKTAEQLADLAEVEDVLSDRRGRRARWMITGVIALMVIVGLVVGAMGASSWIQSRYYVGESEGRVAIYNGVSQSVGPVQLSRIEDTSDVEVADLTSYSRSRVENTIPADDLAHAESIVDGLRNDSGDSAEDPTASPTTSTPSPSESGTVRYPSPGQSTEAGTDDTTQGGDQ